MDAKNLIEDFKMDITCFICSSYFTDPVLVKCGHTFCKECLLSCWKEDQKPISCPTCQETIRFGDFSDNRKLQELAITGKMLRPHLLQSIRGLTICEEHEKEKIFFCEEDHRPLCGPCFLSGLHKEHTVLPLEKACGECMEKLQEAWNILKRKKQIFQRKLEWEQMREAQWEVDVQVLKALAVSEYEKMHQFFLEEEELQFQSLDKEAGDKLAAEESKDSQSQENLNLPMNLEQQPVERVKSEGQSMKQLVKLEFEKKHKLLSEQKELHLQKLDQQRKVNMAKIENSKAKMTQQIDNMKTAMSEIERNFDMLPIEMLQDAKGTLERNEELLLQNPVLAFPRWTIYPIPGIREKLLTFHREITLDPETAHPHLILSDDLKSVEYASVPQDVPNNPERFDIGLFVLATQRFTSGRHYWEVEVGKKTEWKVGICKELIRRKGNAYKLPSNICTLSAFGFGDDSRLWCLNHTVYVNQPLHKVGIFLDYERGHLAFYNATDGTLIYSPPNVVFQEPLCPCFSPCFPKGKNTYGPLRICSRGNWQNAETNEND